MRAQQNQELILYRTEPHVCNYIPTQKATSLFVDPFATLDNQIYSYLVAKGFRRSGEQVYKPHCSQCNSCVPMRIGVNKFRPKRTQKRCQKNNQYLSIHIKPAEFDQEHYELYTHYLNGRHKGAGMDETDESQYSSFLIADWSTTEFIEFRDNGELVALAVTDVLLDGLSAVYTFFRTDEPYQKLSLGVNSILWQIVETQKRQLPWLYLGYWVPQNRKMSYKNQYQPAQYYWNGIWQDKPPNDEFLIRST